MPALLLKSTQKYFWPERKEWSYKKGKDKRNLKSQICRIPSILAYSFRLNLILQIKGPAAKLSFKKKEVGGECEAREVPGTLALPSISRCRRTSASPPADGCRAPRGLMLCAWLLVLVLAKQPWAELPSLAPWLCPQGCFQLHAEHHWCPAQWQSLNLVRRHPCCQTFSSSRRPWPGLSSLQHHRITTCSLLMSTTEQNNHLQSLAHKQASLNADDTLRSKCIKEHTPKPAYEHI